MGSGISFQDQENLNIQIVTAVVNGIIHSRVKNDFPCCNGKKKNFLFFFFKSVSQVYNMDNQYVYTIYNQVKKFC